MEILWKPCIYQKVNLINQATLSHLKSLLSYDYEIQDNVSYVTVLCVGSALWLPVEIYSA